ncbi:MAG: response regulator [Pelagimonas sp.]
MWRLLRENARTLRALVAVCAATALAVLFFYQELKDLEEKERALFSSNSTLWRTSETILEIQRLSAAVAAYPDGRSTKQDIETRFDVLWNRLSLIENMGLTTTRELGPALSTVRVFLEDKEPALYDAPDISDADAVVLAADLELIAKALRRAWVTTFMDEDSQREFLEMHENGSTDRSFDILSLFLIALLMTYVLSEVFMANRAQSTERQLRKMASAANEAKSRFLANVSHEIRTPLNGIMGMAGELGRSDLTEDQRECLSVIEQSGGLLLCTIDDVLDLSKVEAGRFELEYAPFQLSNVLHAARDLHSAKARQKGLTLDLEIDPDVTSWFEGDSRRLQQVLHNLVSNAVKFTDFGGVDLLASRGPNGFGVVIKVSDTGPGIPEAALGRIFEPFAQADVSVTRRYGGTGLGLTISRQICESMGGHLSVESAPGQGTTFEVFLPLKSVSGVVEDVSSVQPEALVRLNGCRILVADDNATNRLIITRYLEPSRCELAQAASGQEALDLMKAGPFDAILMDIQMPGMDGVEATRRIRAMEQADDGRRVPICAVTANVLSHQIDDYLAAGIDCVLPKPLSKRNLLNVLDRMIDTAAPLAENGVGKVAGNPY